MAQTTRTLDPVNLSKPELQPEHVRVQHNTNCDIYLISTKNICFMISWHCWKQVKKIKNDFLSWCYILKKMLPLYFLRGQTCFLEIVLFFFQPFSNLIFFNLQQQTLSLHTSLQIFKMLKRCEHLHVTLCTIFTILLTLWNFEQKYGLLIKLFCFSSDFDETW